MSNYQFFALLTLSGCDTPELQLLKSRYNRMATHMNVHWHMLSENKRQEILTQLTD